MFTKSGICNPVPINNVEYKSTYINQRITNPLEQYPLELKTKKIREQGASRRHALKSLTMKKCLFTILG